MDDEASAWLLVDEIDCAEEAINMSFSVTSVLPTLDSDQESDGSISIISDHPIDSYSEEETEMPMNDDNNLTKVMPIIKIDTEFETNINEENQSQKGGCLVDEIKEKQNGEGVCMSHQASNDDESSTSESSSKQWMFADNKSKLELETPKKTFFLDCSQEPILEVSPDADVDTESTISYPQCQAIVKKDNGPVSNVSSRDSASDREMYINRVSIGFIISMLILTSSYLIRQYLDYSEDGLQSLSPSTSFLDSIADNEKARPIVNFCIDREKSKAVEYSDHAVEKCVVKRLRKKNREEAVKKTEIYLQMKERILELREKELLEREREIMKKWRKRKYTTDDVEEDNRKNSGKKRREDEDVKTSREFNKKLKTTRDPNEVNSYGSSEKEQKTWATDNIQGKIKTFRKRDSWVFEKAREATNWNHKIPLQDASNSNKEVKKTIKDKEETLKHIKSQVKEFQKDKSKHKLKDLNGGKKEDPNEEWYIKYNPVKNTIELINITTLPKQDFNLIKNGNKTINGQWYFSLYGSARANIRNKEKASEWYFRRGHFREHKRDKAKWYFDYMSARDNTRYFY